MKTALTIAGSDSCGGAGIQADLKSMTMNGVYAMSAITALTAQNTTGVTAIQEATPAFLQAQLDAVFTDIFPDAVKVGMVSSAGLIHVIAQSLRRYQAKNIVVDPVMVATSGSRLLREDAMDALQKELLPMACVITPNIPEAELLCGHAITSAQGMEQAAAEIGEKLGCPVLLKGGHQLNDANDLLWQNGKIRWFNGSRIDNPNTHGTGQPSFSPRHRLHAFQRHCGQSGQGLPAGAGRGNGQGLYQRRTGCHAGSGQGLRPHGPCL